MLTSKQLSTVMPSCPADKLDLYARNLSVAMREASINTVLRASAFLGQLALESGELRWMEEFADGSKYEGRKDLGNTEVGDGKRFKGRGPIQLTGRANYRAAGAALALDLEQHPEKALDPTVSFRIAAWFWTTGAGQRLSKAAKARVGAGVSLNTVIDKFDFVGVTMAINGGTTHLDRRQAYYYRALEALGRDVLLIGPMV